MRSPIIETEDSHAAFAIMMHELVRPEAFALIEAAPMAPPVVVHTHVSAVLLTPTRAYKLKKPEDLGFLNYATPELRRHFCQMEVRLNMRLAPAIYLGVAPVVRLPDGHLCFTRICQVDDVPMPGDSAHGGYVVDYAVVMVRMPEEATFESMLHAGQLSPDVLEEAARCVAAFHKTARTDEHVAQFGTAAVIRGNWEENFDQLRPYIGRTLTMATYQRITAHIRAVMDRRTALFDTRIRDGRIRDCHGDLRLQHIYHLGADQRTPHLAILDCIEFNERFRYGDVASEVAFLAMELQSAGRDDLARAFVRAYVAASGDIALQEVLPFYLCYRACVRGKVMSFLLDQREVSNPQRVAAGRQASTFFELAQRYATGPTRPTLVMVGGVMGTGKSTIATLLHAALGWPVLSTDLVRKRLAGLDPTAPHPAAFEQGIYTAAWTERTYQAIQQEAGMLLQDGHAVILDASFIHQKDREMMLATARTWHAPVLFIECTTPRDTVLARLAARWTRRTAEEGKHAVEGASAASDGRPELYDLQCARWEPLVAHRGGSAAYLRLDTSQPEAQCVERILDALNVPRLTCWLHYR